MRFGVLKFLVSALAAMITLSACGTIDTLGKTAYRNHHMLFTETEYQDSPGVLMRASMGTWGKYDENAKMAAIIDFYVDPERRLQPDSFNHQLGMKLENIFSSLDGSKIQIPAPRDLSRDEAQERVHCLNQLVKGLEKRKFRQFLSARYPLFKVEAQCNSFLVRNPIPMECVDWEFSASRSTWRAGNNIVTSSNLKGELVNKCTGHLE